MCEDEYIYEYCGQYMTKEQLCWSMATSSGTMLARKVGIIDKFSEPEVINPLAFTDCFKIQIDNDAYFSNI